MRAPLIAAALLLAVTAWEWSQQQAEGDGIGELLDTLDTEATDIMNRLTGYSYDKVPSAYRAAIAAAESRNGLPDQLLARLLWQESRYRPDIISGRVSSPVGAKGIAQFMPATAADMGIDPLDPEQAIPAAARYLASLYRQTGDWKKALAAYNWGIGNVKRKGLDRAPAETRNYFAQIMADIGLA